MTRDLIEAYRDIFKDNKVVLDSYKLKDGYYYLVGSNNEIKKMVVEKGESDDIELYEYIKIRDFYSVYLNANKSIDTTLKKKIGNKEYNMLKKIFSTNIYTLFFKNDSVEKFSAGENKDELPIDFFKEGIEKYYNSLELLTDNKNNTKEEGYTKEEITEHLNKMNNAFNYVCNEYQNENKKKNTRIKIFLDNSEDEYERVSNFYINQKIFNKDTNKVIDNEKIYGINNYNFNDNFKKPFLELKSTTYKIGSLINTEDINVLRRLYIWLYNNGLNSSMLKIPEEFDFKGEQNDEKEILDKNIFQIKVVNDNGNAKIESFEYIPNYSTNIVEFTYKNIIGEKEIEEIKASNIYHLEWLINNIWITQNMKSQINHLRNSYFDYEEKISKYKTLSNWKKEFLKTYSHIFRNLIQREDKKLFVNKLDEIAIEATQNIIIDDFKAGKGFKSNSIAAMNLWLCLDEYFNKKGGKIVKINDVKDRCKEISLNNGEIKNEDEYYFFVGQVAYFLLSKSRAGKLTQDITEPFIKANNLKTLKKELKFLYDKYNYDIRFRDKRFNNIYSQILLIEPETTVKENKDIILAGLLSENMFYIKKDGGNDDENE